MTYHQAHNLLDMRAAGADMPESVINRALELTGDMEADPVQTAIEELTTRDDFKRSAGLPAGWVDVADMRQVLLCV